MSWVLVVDDNEAIRDCLSQLLEDLGCKAAAARDGVEALALVREARSPPALVLLDLMMPRMNGWQVLEERAKDERLEKVPVVVMTAAKDPTTGPFENVLEVLEKPIEYETLQRVVERVSAQSVGGARDEHAAARLAPDRPV